MHNYWLGGVYAITWILNSKDLEWSLVIEYFNID